MYTTTMDTTDYGVNKARGNLVVVLQRPTLCTENGDTASVGSRA